MPITSHDRPQLVLISMEEYDRLRGRQGRPPPRACSSQTWSRMDRSCSVGASPEIPRLHLDAVDVQVGNVDVARPQPFRRQTARIKSGTAVMEFVAASVRQRKPVVAFADAGEF